MKEIQIFLKKRKKKIKRLFSLKGQFIAILTENINLRMCHMWRRLFTAFKNMAMMAIKQSHRHLSRCYAIDGTAKSSHKSHFNAFQGQFSQANLKQKSREENIISFTSLMNQPLGIHLLTFHTFNIMIACMHFSPF